MSLKVDAKGGSCLLSQQFVHRVTLSAILRRVVEGEESDEVAVIRVGEWRPAMRKRAVGDKNLLIRTRVINSHRRRCPTRHQYLGRRS